MLLLLILTNLILYCFRYEFLAEPAGTHWYHSHTGLQMGEGLFGAFIVRQPKSADCHKDLYSYDFSDHIMVISDWLDITLIERYMKEMHDMFTTDIPINGNSPQVQDFFSYLWDRVCSIFSGAGKFCLAHGLRHLTRDVKETSEV